MQEFCLKMLKSRVPLRCMIAAWHWCQNHCTYRKNLKNCPPGPDAEILKKSPPPNKKNKDNFKLKRSILGILRILNFLRNLGSGPGRIFFSLVRGILGLGILDPYSWPGGFSTSQNKLFRPTVCAELSEEPWRELSPMGSVLLRWPGGSQRESGRFALESSGQGWSGPFSEPIWANSERTPSSEQIPGKFHMLRLEKDIGDNNPVALRRHYGILVVGAQNNKLVVSKNQVTSRDLVLISWTGTWACCCSGTLWPNLAILVFSKHDHGETLTISGMIWIGMTSLIPNPLFPCHAVQQISLVSWHTSPWGWNRPCAEFSNSRESIRRNSIP